ncbi:MAG: LysM peptidoglycan-binding domain-containing protein [Planctomycetota bacterium]|jgi:nucleoid-associated protein YgaU
MRKDFKIGMLLGLALAVIIVFWLSSQERFSIQSQVLQTAKNETSEQQSTSEVRYSAPLPGSRSSNNQALTTASNNNLYQQPDGSSNIDTHKRIHIVSKGETLSSISLQYYGTSSLTKKIFDANQDKIKSPDKLLAGSKIVIPDR